MEVEASSTWRRTAALMASIITLLIHTSFSRADIRIQKNQTSGIDRVDVGISGSIKQDDARALEKISYDLDRTHVSVILNSQGGDVFAAFQVGRLLRRAEATTMIPIDGKCYSSCALIFIAGVARHNYGELGLHRPYVASEPQRRQQLEKYVPEMLSSVKAYISEMRIAENFYYQMVNTEPSQMIRYDFEASRRLVPERDPLHDEIEVSYDARRYGVSTVEMRIREQAADRCELSPNDPDSYMTCGEAQRWGLSERVYRERIKGMNCSFTDSERGILRALPKRERKDHPAWMRSETCERRHMLGLNPQL